MKIHLYTFCYNEINILPFVVDYWKFITCRVIVYDNMSTDGSVEYLRKFDFIEVREYNTNNKLNDFTLVNIKNSCWKESIGIADFVIVCDMDECIYGLNINTTLINCRNIGINVIIPKFYNLISLQFPQYDSTKFIHQQIQTFYIDRWEDFKNDNGKCGEKCKALIFNPSAINNINYLVGCYEANPSGENICIKQVDTIYCMHLHDIGLSRKIKRFAERKQRMSEDNLKWHLSDFYLETRKKIISDFIFDLKRSQKLEV